jgi:hypothetical protein
MARVEIYDTVIAPDTPCWGVRNGASVGDKNHEESLVTLSLLPRTKETTAMVHVTAVAQRLAQGFEVTVQFSESSPSLLLVAMGVIQTVPGAQVLGYNSNTIVTRFPLPWEVLYAFQGMTDIGGVPFGARFFNLDTAALANAAVDLNPDELAVYLHGKSLVQSPISN